MKLNDDGDTWLDVDTTDLTDSDLNSVGRIDFYPLVAAYAIISTQSSNFRQGRVFSAVGTMITELWEISTDSTSDILDFSDGFYNFVRVSSAQI